MSFTDVMKNIAKIALNIGVTEGPSIVTAVNPALGALVTLASTAIQRAEASKAANVDKKTMVLSDVADAVPVLQQLLAHSGLSVQDGQRFATASDQLVEAVLNILKATGAVPANGTQPTAPVSTLAGLGAAGSLVSNVVIQPATTAGGLLPNGSWTFDGSALQLQLRLK